MLKKYISLKTLCAALVLASCISSCSKSVDLLPTDTIDATKAFRNMDDINLGVIGAYAVLTSVDITNTSLVSDEAMLPTENTTGGGVSTHRWQIDGSNTTITAAFNENYIAIDRVNRVLEAIDKVPATAAEAIVRERYRGELLALRAYCHFELIRNYAERYETGAMGLPFMAASGITYDPRPTFEFTMGKIKADLVAAKPLIPTTFTDKSRITNAAVAAIQARVALYEKSWDDAVTFATEVITAAPLATQAQFTDVWLDKSEVEVLWKLKRVAGDSRLGDFYLNSNSVALYTPAFKLLNMYDKTNDIRYKTYIKFDATRGAGKAQYLVNKYATGITTNKNLVDVKLFRTGEMYLIRAEANAEKTNLAAAATDLNTLRARRITGYADQTFAGKQAIIDSVYTERYKELAFEGHRFFDLRRRNLPVTREAADAVNALGAVLLANDKAQYVFPLPDAEVRLGLKQNPKY